jgi:alpha-galactosidase
VGGFQQTLRTCRLNSDNLPTLRPERIALVKEVFQYPAMDETVPLDVWRHATKKSDGFELILARKDKQIYLGVFNWDDATQEYKIPAFGKDGIHSLEARHAKVLTYTGSLSFDEL